MERGRKRRQAEERQRSESKIIPDTEPAAEKNKI